MRERTDSSFIFSLYAVGKNKHIHTEPLSKTSNLTLNSGYLTDKLSENRNKYVNQIEILQINMLLWGGKSAMKQLASHIQCNYDLFNVLKCLLNNSVGDYIL